MFSKNYIEAKVILLSTLSAILLLTCLFVYTDKEFKDQLNAMTTTVLSQTESNLNKLI